MNWTDFYGDSSNSANGTGQLATGPTGPNQSIVTGAGQNGVAVGNAGAAPVAWLGLMLLLILLYVSIRMGARIAA